MRMDISRPPTPAFGLVRNVRNVRMKANIGTYYLDNIVSYLLEYLAGEPVK